MSQQEVDITIETVAPSQQLTEADTPLHEIKDNIPPKKAKK